jgi:molybdenum cofactor cytidylyltransferase
LKVGDPASLAPCPAAIVAAAGASRRMGRPKLLLPYRQGTVLGSLVGTLAGAGVTPIVVVAAASDEALRAWCRTGGDGGAAESPGGNLLIAVNPAPERGMLSSIREGLAALGGAAALMQSRTSLLITPGDLPALAASTVVELLRRQAAAGARLAVPAWRGKRGHPLLVAASLVGEIERLDPERGLRHLIDLYPDDLLTVDLEDPGCVTDLDTPLDYQRLIP